HFMSDPADFNLGGANGQLSPASADGFIVKYSCADTSSSLLTIVECGAAYTVNGVEYTATGIYTQTLANAAGCDSVLTIDLTLNPIEIPIITVNEQVLTVQQTYDAYQWMDEDGDIQ